MKVSAAQRGCSKPGLAFWFQDFLGRSVMLEHGGLRSISIPAALPALLVCAGWQTRVRSRPGCRVGKAAGAPRDSLRVSLGAGEGEAAGA